MFKRATGHTPYLCVTLRRMDRARQLLAETEMPLVQIAAQVGFQTHSHFTRVFRKLTGVTPQVFRLNVSAWADSVQREAGMD
jgi:AraC family transcriptional regulator